MGGLFAYEFELIGSGAQDHFLFSCLALTVGRLDIQMVCTRLQMVQHYSAAHDRSC